MTDIHQGPEAMREPARFEFEADERLLPAEVRKHLRGAGVEALHFLSQQVDATEIFGALGHMQDTAIDSPTNDLVWADSGDEANKNTARQFVRDSLFELFEVTLREAERYPETGIVEVVARKYVSHAYLETLVRRDSHKRTVLNARGMAELQGFDPMSVTAATIRHDDARAVLYPYDKQATLAGWIMRKGTEN